METNRLAFDGIHGDVGSWTKVRAGYVEFPEAALEVDTVHLTSTSLDVSIPMGDGTVYDFQGTGTLQATEHGRASAHRLP